MDNSAERLTPGYAKIKSPLSSYKIHGRFLPADEPSLVKLIIQSYSEIGNFIQLAATGFSQHAIAEDLELMRNNGVAAHGTSTPIIRPLFPGTIPRRISSVSCVDFDSKGIYLAAGTKPGHLLVHKFETLYCTATSGSNKALTPYMYNPTRKALESVKWNPANQEEVACVDSDSNEVDFYGITKDFLPPSKVLTVNSNSTTTGLYDLLFSKLDTSRVLACGKDGKVHIWDIRSSDSSIAALNVDIAAGALNSLQLSNDEQTAYAGSDGGFIHAWDLRGGKRGAAFVASGEVYHPPFGEVKVLNVSSSVPILKAQTEIRQSAVHSISFLNSSGGHRLAFHLNCGWSGVVDMMTREITHLHCPHPLGYSLPVIRRRRPVWIPSLSVYAVGSTKGCKIHMLDFPGGRNRSRSCKDHAGSLCDDESSPFEIATKDLVLAIAAHPLNDELVAGTQSGVLLLLGQKRSSSSQKDSTSSSPEHGSPSSRSQ